MVVTGWVSFGFGLLFKNRQPLWVALTGVVSWVPVVVIGALWGVPYLMRVYAMNNTDAAGINSLFWIGLGVGSPLVGWWSNKIGSRNKPLLLWLR